MLHTTGNTRSLKHNLQLAGLLTFVAGVVNVSGFFAVEVLTTNVTGHYAFFAHDIQRGDYSGAAEYLSFFAAFFCGAIFASALVQWLSRRHPQHVYDVPVIVEIVILTVGAVVPASHHFVYEAVLSLSLLFAMGLQNALGTIISSAVVRTTHLTGLFTDLGIEVGQLLSSPAPDKRRKLRANVGLRVTIIAAFFGGCTVGGIAYAYIGLNSLLIGSLTLTGVLVYDRVKYGKGAMGVH